MFCADCNLAINTDSFTCSHCRNYHDDRHTSIDDLHDIHVCQCQFPRCFHSIFPFNDIDDTELIDMYVDSANTQSLGTQDLNNLYKKFNSNSDSDFELEFDFNCKYYLDDRFIDSFKNVNNSFSLLHFNSRSLNKNFDAISEFVSTLSFNFSIYGFSETWINNSTPLLFDMNGYAFVHSDRNLGKGGGVALLISHSLNYVVRTDLLEQSQNYESLFIEIMLSQRKNIIVGIVYRKPSSNIIDFNCNFEDCLKKIDLECKHAYIMGDFNIDLMKYSNCNSVNQFLSIIYAYSFLPLIDKPSRITQSSFSLIDNIITNNFNSDISSGLFVNDISDHFPVFQVSKKYNLSKNASIYERRKINENTITTFKEKLVVIDWNQTLFCENVEVAYNRFLMKFSNLYDNVFQKVSKIKGNKKRKKPWIDSTLLKKIRKKNKLFKKYRENPNLNTKKKYAQIRNVVNKSLKNARKRFYEHKFQESSGNLKKTWNIIKEVLGSKKNNLPNFVYDNGNTVCGNKNIGNSFNQFFIKIGLLINDSGNHLNNNDYTKFLLQKCSKSLFFKPVTENEIIEVTKKIKCSSSCGIDNLSPVVIKKIIVLILQPLCHILNLSLSSGIVPSKLKISKVIPIYKKDNLHNVSNYRPISLLPFFSKILERIVCNRLYDFLFSNHLLNDYQFGF